MKPQKKQPLTPKQQELFKVLKKLIGENHKVPSYTELCEILGISSASTIGDHIDELVKKGWIDREPGKHRAISIVK